MVLRSLLKNIKPDLLIIANHIPVTLFFPLLGTNAKILKEYHFTQYFKSRKRMSLFRRLESFIESKLDFQVVLNEEEKSFYESDNVIYIPNPIPFNNFHEPAFGHREKVAISAGRISPVKRFDRLLDIWIEFKRSNLEWSLEIYGEGTEDDLKLLRDKIQSSGISDSVEIFKPVNNLPEVMKSKGMYLMTSAQECFPMVLLEAQVSGLPIISYDCPTGPRNIIQSGINGILVEMDNQRSFVNAMHEISKNESLRLNLARNGFDSLQQYQLETVMEIWEDQIIKQLQ
jgi:glycosyltransferase involved in cell wall biosynthesis